jgi:hypothetical protein
MEPFNLYTEALIFVSVFSVVILVPCYFVIMIGRDMMEKIGRFPTQTPAIQVSALLKLIVVEVIAFTLLTSLYRIFSS